MVILSRSAKIPGPSNCAVNPKMRGEKGGRGRESNPGQGLMRSCRGDLQRLPYMVPAGEVSSFDRHARLRSVPANRRWLDRHRRLSSTQVLHRPGAARSSVGKAICCRQASHCSPESCSPINLLFAKQLFRVGLAAWGPTMCLEVLIRPGEPSSSHLDPSLSSKRTNSNGLFEVTDHTERSRSDFWPADVDCVEATILRPDAFKLDVQPHPAQRWAQ